MTIKSQLEEDIEPEPTPEPETEPSGPCPPGTAEDDDDGA
jgi:hypothetical protein